MTDLATTARRAWTWAQESRLTENFGTQLCCVSRLTEFQDHQNPAIRRLARDASDEVVRQAGGTGEAA